MVRKTQFSSEDVVNAAFLVVQKAGIEQLSARNVAQELGSSTAPVYSNFENMEQLEVALFEKAAGKLLEFTTGGQTDNRFLNMGAGILNFARELPQWYNAFSIRVDHGQSHLRGVMDQLLEVMGQMPELQQMHPLERKLLLRKMSIFTHGLATEICSGHADDNLMEDFVQILSEVGATLTADAITRPSRSEAELARLATLCHENASRQDFDKY